MNINSTTIEFIRKHANLIDNNQFDEIYRKFIFDLSTTGGVNISAFTQVLVDAGIDFISHMTQIPAGCFKYVNNIQKIIVPSNIDFIGHQAFAFSSLKYIDLSAISIQRIFPAAFNGCSELKYVKMPETIIEIGESAFSECKSLKRIDIPDSVTKILPGAFAESDLEVIKFPHKMAHIEGQVFSRCVDLRSIYIPKHVTKIDCRSFSTCPNLRDIYYSGSEDRWNNRIKFVYQQQFNESINVHFNVKY